MTQKKTSHQAMTTIALIMLLTASVASVMVKNGLGTCLTYGIKPNSTAAAGRFVITAPCNANDTKQNSWVITQVLNKTGNGNYTFCVNGTTLCSGLQKGFLGIGYNINLRLITKDTTAPEQLWSPTNSTAFPNNFINGATNSCVQAYNAFRMGGVINTVRCRNIPAQQWTTM